MPPGRSCRYPGYFYTSKSTHQRSPHRSIKNPGQTGRDFILACKGQQYIQNQDICNTAITQAFASYLVSIELFAGEKLAKCYRNSYPSLERKSVKDGIALLAKQYDENPELTRHLLGFGFAVAMYSKYPAPRKCIEFKQPGVSI